MKLRTLEKVLNDSFKSPFLPEAFVRAKHIPSKGLLKISIGDRDIEVKDSGRIQSSGTNVGEGKNWSIERRP